MNNKFVREFAEILAKMQDKNDIETFLRDILTPAELDEISRRWQIVKMLNDGLPQRKIAKKLAVSIGTVSRGSRELKYGRGGLSKALNI